MSFPQGISFRNSSGYVTDGANDYGETSSSTNYPTTSPQGNNVGWETISGSLNPRNRDNTNDPRLAGTTFIDSSGNATYRIDLASTGSKSVRLAAGEANYGFKARVELFDTVTSLGFLANRTNSGSQRFTDATNTEYTNATWPGSNTASSQTFATTICRFKISSVAGDTDDIAYFSVDNVASSGAISGTTALTFGQTGALTGAGALAGTSALTFGQTGLLKGTGALAGSSALTFGQSGSLTGAGALAGTSALTFAATATINQPGAIAGTATLTFGQSGLLTAEGSLAGVATLTFDAQATADHVANQFSGGWESFFRHEQNEIKRRRQRKKEQEDAEEAQENERDAEIARFLHEQERKDDARKDLERVKALVKTHAKDIARDTDSERVAKALQIAEQKKTQAAYEMLTREIERAWEEDEFALLMLLAND